MIHCKLWGTGEGNARSLWGSHHILGSIWSWSSYERPDHWVVSAIVVHKYSAHKFAKRIQDMFGLYCRRMVHEEKKWTLWDLNPRPLALFKVQSERSTPELNALVLITLSKIYNPHRRHSSTVHQPHPRPQLPTQCRVPPWQKLFLQLHAQLPYSSPPHQLFKTHSQPFSTNYSNSPTATPPKSSQMHSCMPNMEATQTNSRWTT